MKMVIRNKLFIRLQTQLSHRKCWPGLEKVFGAKILFSRHAFFLTSQEVGKGEITKSGEKTFSQHKTQPDIVCEEECLRGKVYEGGVGPIDLHESVAETQFRVPIAKALKQISRPRRTRSVLVMECRV